MALLLPEIGEALTFDEVKRLVEAVSPAIELQEDSRRGRFLVAKKALKCGEVLLSELPLFYGSIRGSQSTKACKEEEVAKIREAVKEERLAEYGQEDVMHPCSPLIDCLAGILWTRSEALHCKDSSDRARAKLKIRQFNSLARTCVNETEVTDESCQTMLDMFSPEVGSLDKDALRGVLKAISSNRFSGIDLDLDLMFAGSMFEHSCQPNCFAGNWKRAATLPRQYRAMRDIEVGEALSISYIQLPDLYMPTAGRAKLIAGWGFVCACPRCTVLPELTRAFLCAECSEPELCPTKPGPDAELSCRKCKRTADASYAKKCLASEALLERISEGVEELSADGGADSGGADVFGCFHHAAFRVAWQVFDDGPSPETLFRYADAIEDLITAITRLHGDPRNPNLLELYHIMAELEIGNIEGQQHFLELEHATMQHHYPEEAQRQDDEIWHICQGRGPYDRNYNETWQDQVAKQPEDDDIIDNTDLSGMD